MTWVFYLFEIIGTWRLQVQVVVASSEKDSVSLSKACTFND